ncbi:prepilin-type N-terminal cleavage/methylation domain-containing protein [Candidatus Parcubacteria bacterium]|nr:MAG: prepilin-type N-terminal cleavage/methylation domain-containing protein [Candidatus Parcubacteria bacterium]
MRTIKGFTLLETLVALAIVVGGVLGPFALANRSLAVAKFSRNELIAANLAAEGIELIHGYRTSNLLSGQIPPMWDQGLGQDGSSREYQVDVICTSSTCRPGSGRTPNFQRCGPVNCANPLLWDAATGLYSYAGGVPTPFVRVVTIDRRDPPSNRHYDDAASPVEVPREDQMTIISRVTWVDGGRTRQVELVEVLYNWGQALVE